MKKVNYNLNNKQTFYGFRKAFLKNPEVSMEARFLIVLLFCYKGKNLFCWPSMGELSRICGKNKDTIRKYFKELEIHNYLKIRSRGIGRSHLYTPSYCRISSGSNQSETPIAKPAEETMHQPDETTLNRSISSGNKDNGFKTGKELLDQKRRELGI